MGLTTFYESKLREIELLRSAARFDLLDGRYSAQGTQVLAALRWRWDVDLALPPQESRPLLAPHIAIMMAIPMELK